MKIVHTDRIDPEKGDYLIVVDNGSEGLTVESQHATVEDAVYRLGNQYGRASLLKIVDLVVTMVGSGR